MRPWTGPLLVTLLLAVVLGGAGACALFDSAAASTYAADVAQAKHAAELAAIQAKADALVKGLTDAEATRVALQVALDRFKAEFQAAMAAEIARQVATAGSSALTGNVIGGAAGLGGILMATLAHRRAGAIGANVLAQLPDILANTVAPPALPVVVSRQPIGAAAAPGGAPA